MREVVIPPVSEVFERWGETVKKVVGEGNYSMKPSSQIAKAPYARIYMLGSPGDRYDLEGNEVSIVPTFQVESFADGRKAVENAYKIDNASHVAMTQMGFRRTFGGQIVMNANEDIIRVISRYSRVYTGEEF